MQPLHWHQKRNRPKRWEKSDLNCKTKNVSKRVDFASPISTCQESYCLPYEGFFWMASPRFLPNLCHVNNFKSVCGIYFPVKSHKTFRGHSGLFKPEFELVSRNYWEEELHFSSPWTFKLSSAAPKVIQVVVWYHVVFLVPWTIHLLFQNPH